MSEQGLNPPDVWTREYVRTELWGNVYGEPLPLDADPEPKSVELKTCILTAWLSGGCQTMLDVGCGWMWYAAPSWMEITGADISPPMLELGESLHPDRTFVEASSFDLPFDDNEFCGVRSSGMLRHIKDWQAPLEEMIRVASDRLAFTHLTSDEPGKCDRYQWCVDVNDVIACFPSGTEIEIQTHKPKEHRRFESTRFLAVLP